MLIADKIKKKLTEYGLTGVAKRVFGDDKPSNVHDFYKAAKSTQVRKKEEKLQSFFQKISAASLKNFKTFAGNVYEQAPKTKQSGIIDVRAAAEEGKTPKAVWNMITAGHIRHNLYLCVPGLVDTKGYMGIEHGRKTADAVIRYLEKNNPELLQELKKVFDFCEQNDMAVSFSYPQKQEDVPYGFKSIVRKPDPENKPFWKVEITVSPLDPHYKPLTVGPVNPSKIHGYGSGGNKGEQDARFWFSDRMRSRLHADGLIKRLITGRTYSM